MSPKILRLRRRRLSLLMGAAAPWTWGRRGGNGDGGNGDGGNGYGGNGDGDDGGGGGVDGRGVACALRDGMRIARWTGRDGAG